MKVQHLIATLVASAALTGTAFAQEASPGPVIDATQGKSRVEVRSETLQARKDGAFEQVLGAYRGFPVQGDPASALSRAEVRREVKEEFRQARANGENFTHGEAD